MLRASLHHGISDLLDNCCGLNPEPRARPVDGLINEGASVIPPRGNRIPCNNVGFFPLRLRYGGGLCNCWDVEQLNYEY